MKYETSKLNTVVGSECELMTNRSEIETRDLYDLLRAFEQGRKPRVQL